MKVIVTMFFIIVIAGCKTKPYVKHSVEFEKIGDKCDQLSSSLLMNSNLNGERFEFQSCLDVDFKKEQLTSYQANDTTVVIKVERKNPQQALYKLTLDIDAYPRYSSVIIDRDTILMKAIEP